MYVELTVSQTMEHFLSCHEHAFAAFGGVPTKIMVDNLKSAVLQRLAGVAPVFNPRYVDFARHYGFAIVPCNVARGNEKGRVESGVGYVKKNFLRGLELTELGAIEAAAQVWLDTIANVRVHGETHQRPLDLFAQERPHLQPLNQNETPARRHRSPRRSDLDPVPRRSARGRLPPSEARELPKRTHNCACNSRRFRRTPRHGSDGRRCEFPALVGFPAARTQDHRAC